MENTKENGKKIFRGPFWLLLALVGLAGAYTPAIPEPAKLLLLGVVLVGVAFWGRRQLGARANQGQ